MLAEPHPYDDTPNVQNPTEGSRGPHCLAGQGLQGVPKEKQISLLLQVVDGINISPVKKVHDSHFGENSCQKVRLTPPYLL